MLNPAFGEAAGRDNSAEQASTLERGAIAICFLAMAVLAYTRNVNWDEFHYLSFVHLWLDGELDRPMQMGHVHAFGWLDLLPGSEMTQIFAARLVMLGCVAVTALSIHRIAAHFTTARFATLAVLAYLCSGFVLAHGGSFRADPIAAALLTSALAVAMTSRLAVWHLFVIGLLVALAHMVTIKSALYLPCFLGVLVWRLAERGAVLRLCFAALLAGGKDTVSTASGAVRKTLLSHELFPRSDTILSWALFSLPQIALALLAFKAAGRSRLFIVLLLFIVPLMSVVIYRNAFVYFFPFAVPLLMVAAAIGAHRFLSQVTLERAVLLMLAGAALQVALILPENARTQRDTIAEVHRLFDAPVSYIDGYGMVSSFDNTSFFTSSWGVAGYRARGAAVFPDIIATKRPPLLIAHRRPLGAAMWEDFARNSDLDLLPEDRAALRASYVHYSGSLWLAGAHAELGPEPQVLTLPFPGRYRIEATGPVVINSVAYKPGDSLDVQDLELDVTGDVGTKLRLIWDTGVPPIERGALGNDVFAGFTRLVLFD